MNSGAEAGVVEVVEVRVVSKSVGPLTGTSYLYPAQADDRVSNTYRVFCHALPLVGKELFHTPESHGPVYVRRKQLPSVERPS